MMVKSDCRQCACHATMHIVFDPPLLPVGVVPPSSSRGMVRPSSTSVINELVGIIWKMSIENFGSYSLVAREEMKEEMRRGSGLK